MQKKYFLLGILFSFSLFCNAQYKKDGTPDMRYSANKQSYSSSYSSPTYSSGVNSSSRYQSGYTKSSGTYVESHYKTYSNSTNLDNYSTKGNHNPYTGNSGSRAQDYSNDAYNYGSGRTINTGPKGGQYYVNDRGSKIYVPKRY